MQAQDKDQLAPQGYKALTKKQWYRICNAGAGQAQSLAGFDVSKSFVYSREFGIFSVDHGHHQQVMATLYAFNCGFASSADMLDDLYHRREMRKDSSYLADLYLEKIPGTAFRSSVGKCVTTGTRASLTAIEKRIFGELKYAFEA